jgi:branched-chain amino acid transport system ATP-binding protein
MYARRIWATTMLRLERVAAWYGSAQALFGVDLQVNVGEVVALLGRNGMGKTTTVSSIMGLADIRDGSITFDDVELRGQAAHRIARLGLGLVPEGRQIFPNLTVGENLVATQRQGPWTIDRVLTLFPRLGERYRQSGDRLSGGEQQMLAIGRALLTNPRLLILDEAAEGLAPLVRKEIWACLNTLKGEGQSILVIDRHLGPLMRLADRHYIIEKGHIVWTGQAAELRANASVRERYLGV